MRPRTPHWRSIKLDLTVMLAVTVGLGSVIAIATDRSFGISPRTPVPAAALSMLEVAPGGTVDLDGLPPTTQALYVAAEALPDLFEAVTCYCGCEDFLGHRHLRDCFIRPDGLWELHGSACGICIAQAIALIGMNDAAVPREEMIQRIDARFGAVLAGR